MQKRSHSAGLFSNYLGTVARPRGARTCLSLSPCSSASYSSPPPLPFQPISLSTPFPSARLGTESKVLTFGSTLKVFPSLSARSSRAPERIPGRAGGGHGAVWGVSACVLMSVEPWGWEACLWNSFGALDGLVHRQRTAVRGFYAPRSLLSCRSAALCGKRRGAV